MLEKRALIVDDSKSARVVLSRMLEKYELAVDTSDSAEQALEYLKAHRPDVIFMDHLMPGMDGLAAVQAIRSNPDTAAIPIMMYTSQEGELYLGQARALGANGVLPKRIGSGEVSRILGELQLLADAPPVAAPVPVLQVPAQSGPSVAGPTVAGPTVAGPLVAGPLVAGQPADRAAAPPQGPVPGALSPADVQRVLEPLLKQHSADLRRFVVASLDSFAARVVTETREVARVAAVQPVLAATPVAALAPAGLAEPAASAAGTTSGEGGASHAGARRARPTGWIALASAAAVAALAAGTFAVYQQRQIDALAALLAARERPAALAMTESAARPPGAAAQPQAAAAAATSAAPEAAPGAAPAAAPPAPTVVAAVPFAYGVPPLDGEPLAQLGSLLAEIERTNAPGVVTVTLHAGDFCLTGNPAEGYALAPDEMPADRCDLVGNPPYDALRPAQRPGAKYDELLDSVRARADGALSVRVADAGRSTAKVEYPAGGGVTAAEWNAVAAANQRVEFAFAPRALP